MKIPFSIKYRPQVESGEYKVETRDAKPIRIICFDAPTENYPIIGVSDDPKDDPLTFTEEGKYIFGEDEPDSLDLFIVTPEEELTEFEKAIKDMIKPYAEWPDDIFKEASAKLLPLARKQLIQGGYVIEKKAFYDAVEKVSPEVMKEVSENIDNEIAQLTEFERAFDNFAEAYHSDSNPDDVACCKEYATKLLSIAEKELSAKYRFSSDLNGFAYGKGYKDGKKDALKDLPRWIPNKFDKHNFETCRATPRYLCYQNKMIDVSELVEKLPGFKED